MIQPFRQPVFYSTLFVLSFWALVGQTACAVPLNSLPGAINQSNTQPWATPSIPQKDRTAPDNQTPLVEPDETLDPIEFEPVRRSPKSTDDTRVFVKTIVLNGCTLLDQQETEQIFASYRNKELRFGDLQTLSDELTQHYIDKGYINSYVYIPPQTFENGILRLSCLEAKIGAIHMEKPRWFGDRAIRPRLNAQVGEHFRLSALEKSLRLINENPDLNVAASLEKGEDTGTTQVILKARSHFPVHLTPFYDNLGRESIGYSRYGFSVAHNNLLGYGDIMNQSLSFTRHSIGVIEQYALPIGRYGTKLGFDYAYSGIQLGGALKPLKIHSSAQIWSPTIHQPLIRTDRSSLDLNLAFDFKNLKTSVLGEPFNRDRLRVLRSSLEGFHYDRWGRTIASNEWAVGLPFFNATTGDSPLASKAGSGNQFFRTTGSLTRIQKLPLGTMGLFRGRYQYSSDRLLSAEQSQVGGAYTVRGYPEGQAIGDKSYNLTAEYYIPSYFFPNTWKLPRSQQPLRQALQWVAFSDYGVVYTNKPRAGESRKESLLGTGLGVRLALSRFLVVRVDLGIPLLDPSANATPLKRKAQLHFGLQSTIFLIFNP